MEIFTQMGDRQRTATAPTGERKACPPNRCEKKGKGECFLFVYRCNYFHFSIHCFKSISGSFRAGFGGDKNAMPGFVHPFFFLHFESMNVPRGDGWVLWLGIALGLHLVLLPCCCFDGSRKERERCRVNTNL